MRGVAIAAALLLVLVACSSSGGSCPPAAITKSEQVSVDERQLCSFVQRSTRGEESSDARSADCRAFCGADYDDCTFGDDTRLLYASSDCSTYTSTRALVACRKTASSPLGETCAVRARSRVRRT